MRLVRPLKDNESGFFIFLYIIWYTEHRVHSVLYLLYIGYRRLCTLEVYLYEGVRADQLCDDYIVIITILLAIRVRLYSTENTTNNIIICVTPVRVP